MKPDEVMQAIKASSPMDWVIKFSKLSKKFAEAKKKWKTKKLQLERMISQLQREKGALSDEIRRSKTLQAEKILQEELSSRAKNDTLLKQALAKVQKDLKEGRGTKAKVAADINLALMAWEDRLND